MSLAEDLENHAVSLFSNMDPNQSDDVTLRRIVSTAYYSLFHRLNADAVALIAPNVSPQTNHRIQRWFDHGEMKKVCGRFMKDKVDQPLLGLIGDSASADLQEVCKRFVALQEARHSSDYDLDYILTWAQTYDYLQSALVASRTWNMIKHTPEANIFILSLLLWKNWEEKDRR